MASYGNVVIVINCNAIGSCWGMWGGGGGGVLLKIHSSVCNDLSYRLLTIIIHDDCFTE